MLDSRRALLDEELAAALADGELSAVHSAADAILAHAREAKVIWAIGTSKLNLLTLRPDDWAAVMALSDPAKFGRALWARHKMSSWRLDELDGLHFFSYGDPLKCFVATGIPATFPPLEYSHDLPDDTAEYFEALEVIADGRRHGDRAEVEKGIALYKSWERDWHRSATKGPSLYLLALQQVSRLWTR